MTFATLSKLADADILGRMSKEETHYFLSWPFKWLHCFCNTLKALYPACKFPFIFREHFWKHRLSNLEGIDLNFLFLSFHFCYLLSQRRKKMKEKNETFLHGRQTLASQICKGMLNTLTNENIKLANWQSIAKPTALGNGRYVFYLMKGLLLRIGLGGMAPHNYQLAHSFHLLLSCTVSVESINQCKRNVRSDWV